MNTEAIRAKFENGFEELYDIPHFAKYSEAEKNYVYCHRTISPDEVDDMSCLNSAWFGYQQAVKDMEAKWKPVRKLDFPHETEILLYPDFADQTIVGYWDPDESKFYDMDGREIEPRVWCEIPCRATE